jgi:hypothetical protein
LKIFAGNPATDIQTGEKVFKKEVLESIKIQARRWDLIQSFFIKLMEGVGE